MPEPTPPIQKPLRYGFLLLPQFSLSAWALAADALTRANVLAERRVFETLTLSLEGERDFVGKAALTINGRRAAFLGLVLLDKGVLRSHQKVHCPLGVGEITSGTFSPTLGQSIALARLPLGVVVGDEVEVEIRDKRLKAKVVQPPFARNGQGLL